MCRALLEASADVTQLDGNGLTALDLARRKKVDISKGAWHKRIRDMKGSIVDRCIVGPLF